MPTLDIELSKRDGLVSRLVVREPSARDKLKLLTLPGANERESGDISFPSEPMRIANIKSAVSNLEVTWDATAWLDEERAEYMLSMMLQEREDCDLDVPFARILYPYQRVGADWLYRLRRVILGDEMGLGKTLQCLAAAYLVGGKGLIITVNMAKRSVWEYHIQKYWPQLAVPTYVCEGDRSKRQRTIEHFQSDRNRNKCVIVNHDMLRPDQFPLLAATDWDWVIIDEAHKFQDMKSKRSEGAAALQTRYLFLATGTPVWNKIESVFGLPHLVNPHRWRSFWDFVKEYCVVEPTQYGTEVVGLKPEKVKQARALFAPIILRRTKRQVLPQLPPVRIDTITYDLSPIQRKAYRQLKRTYTVKDEGGAVTYQADSVSERFHALRRLVNEPGLLNLRMEGTKREVLKELLDEALNGGHKVVIFTWYHDYTDQVSIDLDKQEIPHAVIYGGNSEKVNNAALATFQTDPNVPVLVANIACAGTAIDLTVADIVIFAEGSYIASDVSQAIARLDRHGQTRKVMVYRLAARKTVEEDVWATVDDNEAQASAVLAQRRVMHALDVTDDD